MLKNISNRDELKGLLRKKNRSFDTKTVNAKVLEDEIANNWTVVKKNLNTVQLNRDKNHGKLLEDRVWSLFYRMGFNKLSGEGGAILEIKSKTEQIVTSQIDVVGIDNEVAIAVECKSSAAFARRPQFQEEIGKFSLIRENFIQSIRNDFADSVKKQPVLCMFLFNINLSENDKVRAKEAKIILFDSNDLDYYEKLVNHIGQAAKYQFLADMLPGKAIPGLSIRIPAIKNKIGKFVFYTFSITPDFLLKISYVSHRAKGKASDINTYQRMLSKQRLQKIKEYISEDGIFPTNIVVNFESNRLKFERAEQKANEGDAGILGWLDIKASYKSAWIIDGQHRLFAYSGHPMSSKSKLSVLAFEGLLPSKQAELFIDINAKQNRVKQSLLQELYAELHWDADDIESRVKAIISKSIQELNSHQLSPFYKRIQSTEGSKTDQCCISLTSMFGEIEKKGFYIGKEKNGNVIVYGPLWAGENRSTLDRTVFILKKWFELISSETQDWWNKGSGIGGGLAMNDGVGTCIKVLRSVFEHLESKGLKLVELNNEELFSSIKNFGSILGKYLGGLNEDERKRFRDLRGVQGLTTRMRRCQQAIHDAYPPYNPTGLNEFIEAEKAQTNDISKKIIEKIEDTLQKVILNELHLTFGDEEFGWWMQGVPTNVRLEVSERFEKDEGKRGGKEFYFDFIHYKKIIESNWTIFESLFSYEKKGSKEKRLAWLDFINKKRNELAHKSSRITISIEEMDKLENYANWLEMQVEMMDSSSMQ